MNNYYLQDQITKKELDVAENLSVGRSEDNDLVVSEGHASRRHARLYFEGNELWLEDLGSANGTFVNNERLTSPRVVNSGDVLRFDTAIWTLNDKSEDSQATIRRTEPAAIAEQHPNPETSPPAPSSPSPVKATSAAAPRSWQEEDEDQGTQALSAEEFAEIRRQLGQADVGTTDRPQLLIRSGSREGQVVELDGDNREWRIGSASSAELQFSDENVSAEQAVLSVADGRWKLADQFSKNRTFVNGKQANVSYLNAGDSISFGRVTCVLNLPAGKATKEANAPASSKGRKNLKPLLIGAIALVVSLGLVMLIRTSGWSM